MSAGAYEHLIAARQSFRLFEEKQGWPEREYRRTVANSLLAIATALVDPPAEGRPSTISHLVATHPDKESLIPSDFTILETLSEASVRFIKEQEEEDEVA